MSLTNDAVLQPKHYEVWESLEAIEIIAASMTEDQFRGYCFGNLMKYRLRAGKKDALQQDINKADNYIQIFNNFKYLCRKESIL